VTVRRVGDAKIVGVAFKTSALSDEDAAPLEVLSSILTDNPSGRLYKAMVDTQLASFVYGYVHLWKDPGIMMTFAEVPSEKSHEEVRDVMLKTVEDVIQNPVTEQEVNRAKSNFQKNFDLAFNSSERIGLQLSEYIGAGDWRLMFIQRDRVRDVTVEDVQRVAANYLKQDNRTIGMFIPVEKPDRTVIPGEVNIAELVVDYRGGEGLEAGEAFEPNPEIIESRTVRHELSNGMKIAFLNKKSRGSAVNFNFTFRFGNEKNLKNKGFIGDYTASLLDKGTASKSREEINDEFDRLKSNVYFFGSASATFCLWGNRRRKSS
jgi:zinc protease